MSQNFIPLTQAEAVAQYAKTALDYRRDYRRPRSIGRQVAMLAIRKAKRVRDAADWKAEVWKPL